MSTELKLLHPENIKQDLITFFKRKSLIPIVGSGISCKVQAFNGNIPTGLEYKQHMLKELKANNTFNDNDQKELSEASFSTLCDYYEDDEHISSESRFIYLKNNFYRTKFAEDDVRKLFFEIDWPYIYSLNIDDAIERSSEYTKVILPKRDFRDEVFAERKCLIKLHGDIEDIFTYKDGGKIFTSKEYALALEQNAPLLNKLRNDYSNQNILYIGCSLDDEFDLKSLTNIPVNFSAKDSLRKTIIFIKGEPSKLQRSKYKIYGITDVVSFNDYNSMYVAIFEAWNESQLISECDVIGYENIASIDIKSSQKEKNHDYFFWGKGLLNSITSQMSYPYYFISRDISSNIVRNLNQNKIHLVSGSRISGKSYLLSGLYREIRDRKVYYFDGKTKLSTAAVQKLLDFTNTAMIFDIGALSREQFEIILESTKIIHGKRNNFIICINDNDSDTKGIIRYKLERGRINERDLLSYTLSNKFSADGDTSEKERLNRLLPVVSLPPYHETRTILDHIIYAEGILDVKSQYTKHNITISHYKQLALLIILAIKEKMFSIDIVSFALDLEIAEALKRYDPFIERVETLNYEKDSTDISSLKYALNSKYWLRKELGKYARKNDNYAMISDAYKYIIRKAIGAAGTNKFQQRKNCKSYIMFDVLNDVFLNRYGGTIKLIVQIYDQLHEQLATDYNFLHQNAKCLVNYSYFLKERDDAAEKESLLLRAKELAVISKSMIEQSYKDSSNEHLLISIAHVQFTIASIQCNICKIHSYSNIEEIEYTVPIVSEAIRSPYNMGSQQSNRTSKSIFDFIREVYKKMSDGTLNIEMHRREISELMTLINFRV